MTKKKGKQNKVSYPNKNHQAKKAAVLNKPKTSKMPLIIASVVILAAVAGITAFLFSEGGDSQIAFQPAAPTAAADPDVVTYPVAAFADGVARHFEHQNGDITIRYFILRSSDGVIRAAFDACDVCWPAGKGYYQEGDTMVCRNCGRRFKSVLVNEVKGGCNPAPLKREIDGQNLVINIDDIRKGQQYFDFKGKA